MKGLNKQFIRDPAAFLELFIIVMPTVDENPWHAAFDNEEFDLRSNGECYSGKCCLLSMMELRGKPKSKSTNCILGSWVTLSMGGGFTTNEVNAIHTPYFIFTERLGGCAIGIKNEGSANTTFAHDPEPSQGRLSDYELILTADVYDPSGKGINTSGVSWWDGKQWNIRPCRTYDSKGYNVTINGVKYIK